MSIPYIFFASLKRNCGSSMSCAIKILQTLSIPSRYNLLSLFSSNSFNPNIKESGLYGIPLLKTAKGFRNFVDESIEIVGELVSRISSMQSEEVVKAMDEISNTVCCVIDAAELCRNTHPDREFVEEANKASMRISEYLHFLNTNHTLYNAILMAEREGSILSEEGQRAVHSLRIDFEKGGIHLPTEKLELVNQLNSQIALLGRQEKNQ